MKTIAKTIQQTKASPETIFNIWADIDGWSDFDQGIEWAKLTDTFTTGGHYTLKPKGGPKVKATITLVKPNEKFIDVSHLPGAKLIFDHTISTRNDATEISITMTLHGPLTWLWVKVLGKDQQADLEKSTANLIVKAEKM